MKASGTAATASTASVPHSTARGFACACDPIAVPVPGHLHATPPPAPLSIPSARRLPGGRGQSPHSKPSLPPARPGPGPGRDRGKKGGRKRPRATPLFRSPARRQSPVAVATVSSPLAQGLAQGPRPEGLGPRLLGGEGEEGLLRTKPPGGGRGGGGGASSSPPEAAPRGGAEAPS